MALEGQQDGVCMACCRCISASLFHGSEKGELPLNWTSYTLKAINTIAIFLLCRALGMLMLSKSEGGSLVFAGRDFGALGWWRCCPPPDPQAVFIQGRVSLCPPLVASAQPD